MIFSGGLRVDGEVRRNINSENGQDGTLILSEKANVEGVIAVCGTVIEPVFAG